MGIFSLHLLVLTALLVLQTNAQDNNFNTYYNPNWGQNHITVNPQGTEAQLLIDQSSGAGFRSKSGYGSGLFHMKMKITDKKTGGIITSFYLTSVQPNEAPGNHFELDFEFMGTNGRLSTNIFNNDSGHREQAFNLWFDPSQDFHSYDILWNSHQIVFFVDNIPLRIFKNNTAHGLGYISKPLHIEASLWEAPWAGKVDWSLAPFFAYYQDFGFNACTAPAAAGGSISDCASENYPWNQPKNWQLSDAQKQQMKDYRAKYMAYDYCTNSPDHDKKLECTLNDA